MQRNSWIAGMRPMLTRNLLKSQNKELPYEDSLWDITAVPAGHDKREECLVYIYKKGGKTVSCGHDTGAAFSREAWEMITAEQYDLISLDATMGTKSTGGYHMSLSILFYFHSYGSFEKSKLPFCYVNRRQREDAAMADGVGSIRGPVAGSRWQQTAERDKGSYYLCRVPLVDLLTFAA